MTRIRTSPQFIGRHEIRLTVVFDGAPLPSKRGTEIERAKSRAEALEKAKELEALGDKSLAQSFFSRAVDVTPQMAFEVSLQLKQLDIPVIVAPYEADAQLGYLSRNNLVDVVISEDSDLIVYGCRRVLYKLDFKTEQGREMNLESVFNSCLLSRLSGETFLLSCVLAGCDYGPSLASVGIKSALALGGKAEGMLRSRDKRIDSISFLEKLLILIRLSGIEICDEEAYISQVRQAIQTFYHQTVFCPIQRRLVPLSPLRVIEDPSFLGEMYDSSIACGVADCVLDPDTKIPFVPTTVPSSEPKKEYRPKNIKRKFVSEKIESSEKKLVDLWSSKSVVEEVVLIPDSPRIIKPVEPKKDSSSVQCWREVSHESPRNLESLDAFSACLVKPSARRISTEPVTLHTLDQLRFNP